jgi:hypothetical protein
MKRVYLLGLLCLACSRNEEDKPEKSKGGRCEVCPQGGVALPTGASGAFGIASPASIADNCAQTQCP